MGAGGRSHSVHSVVMTFRLVTAVPADHGRLPRNDCRPLVVTARESRGPAAMAGPQQLSSGHLQTVIFQWEAAVTVPSRGSDGVEDRGRRDRNGRFTNAAPEAARGHYDRLHLWHLSNTHHVIGVEVLLLDPPRLDGALAHEQRGQAVYEGARNLPLDLRRIDGVARIRRCHDAVDLDVVAVDRPAT
jgi:hypothetical protein